MPRLAIYAATVPPPPRSTLPSSPVCQIMLLFSIRARTLPTNSAEASEVPDFPLEPVNLVTTTPLFRKAALRFSTTSGKVGSNAAFTSAERHSELDTRVLPFTPKLSARSYRKFLRYAEQSPVLPSLPVSSLSVRQTTAVLFTLSQPRIASRAV